MWRGKRHRNRFLTEWKTRFVSFDGTDVDGAQTSTSHQKTKNNKEREHHQFAIVSFQSHSSASDQKIVEPAQLHLLWDLNLPLLVSVLVRVYIRENRG